VFGCFGIVLLAQFANAAPVRSYEKAHKPYDELLGRYCPTKHLDMLSPADLNDVIDSFRDSLSSSQKVTLDRIADPKTACSTTIAGASCANTAYLIAAEKLKLMPKFARMVCNLPVTCQVQSDCR
jgi:hypothetical protein